MSNTFRLRSSGDTLKSLWNASTVPTSLIWYPRTIADGVSKCDITPGARWKDAEILEGGPLDRHQGGGAHRRQSRDHLLPQHQGDPRCSLLSQQERKDGHLAASSCGEEMEIGIKEGHLAASSRDEEVQIGIKDISSRGEDLSDGLLATSPRGEDLQTGIGTTAAGPQRQDRNLVIYA